MKRKFLCLLLALTMVLSLAATVSADEGLYTSGDWTYRIVRGEAVLCTYNGTATDVVLPDEVKSIAGGIIWPETVKFITMPRAMYNELPSMPHCINTAEITIIPVE